MISLLSVTQELITKLNSQFALKQLGDLEYLLGTEQLTANSVMQKEFLHLRSQASNSPNMALIFFRILHTTGP